MMRYQPIQCKNMDGFMSIILIGGIFLFGSRSSGGVCVCKAVKTAEHWQTVSFVHYNDIIIQIG